MSVLSAILNCSNYRNRGLSLAFLILILSFDGLACQLFAQSSSVPSTPNGWSKKTVRGKRSHVAFSKKGLGWADYLSVKFYKHEPLLENDLGLWIQNRLIEGNAPLGGKWSGPIERLTRMTRNIYTAQREFEVSGRKHLIEVAAVCVDQLNVRMAATISSQTREVKKHTAQAQKLMAKTSET